MIEFKQLDSLTNDELFKELGIADFTYIELTRFLEELEIYRSQIHKKLKDNNDRSVDSRK